MVSEKKPSRSNVLPVILILAGVLLLIGNFNWGLFWNVLQFWPLILVAVGVDILLAGRYRLAIIVGTLVIGALFYTGTVRFPGIQGVQTHQIEQTLENANKAVVHLQPSVGSVTIRSAAITNLAEGTIKTGTGERLVQDFRVTNEVAYLDLESKQQSTNIGNFGRQDRSWTLTLNNRVPLDLNIDSGVGRSELDLRTLQLEKLELSSGVGELIVTLPEQGRYEASLDTGVGTTTVNIPKGVAARITVSRGLGAVNVQGTFGQEGDVYTSPDYTTAEHQVKLSVSSGVGAVTIRTDR
jgi:hypothetical protein